MSRREECAIETRKRTVLAWRANTKDILDFCVSLILTWGPIQFEALVDVIFAALIGSHFVLL